MKILILGGYGVFGGRLAQLLADVSGVELLIAGRDEKRAQAFCAAFCGAATTQACQVDRRDITDVLRQYGPDLVVDASGPFQDYGDNRYGVIEACIAAGVDYCDFADSAEFVAGVGSFDASARAAGIFVLSGVSSFPVLTAAVLREIATTMDILSVEGGIAPSPYAGIGLNVMRAVVSYAGAPVTLWRDGRWAEAIGLAESRRFTIAVPGRVPLRNIRFSLVDVPDLRVLPSEHPTMTDIWMGAGPVPESLHRILNLLARARATFGLPSMLPLSRLFYGVLNRMRFGEHRGGMYVLARGVAAGGPVERSWHLVAEGDDGPFIPSMAIEAIIRKLLAGARPAIGARSAVRALDLADYDALFRGRRIETGFRDGKRGLPLYRRLLGSAFERLPPRIRELHDSSAPRRWSGEAEVRRGTGLLARLVAALFGFPSVNERVPVTVTFSPQPDAERWTRNFGGRTFSSTQSSGTGRNEALLVERFGPVAVAMALVVQDERLHLIPRRWSLFGMPMPHVMLPCGTAFESEENGVFRFDVEIALPFVGRVVAYRGALRAETATA